MKTVLFLAAALIATSSAPATIVTYLPTRDTYMRGVAITDLHGSSPTGRASKTNLDFYLSDFDRATIVGAIEGEIGHALTIDDMANVEISWSLFSNDNEGYQPTALSRPAVFQGQQDWVEGSDTTAGATKGYALYVPGDPANTRQWTNRSGAPVSGFINLDKVENAVFEEWGGQAFTYRKWVLDDNVAFAYLTDPLSLGLFLNASDQNTADPLDARYSNTEVYSRERTNPAQQPFLEVIVVPEPNTISVAGFGVFLTFRRSRFRP
jgi:hypothetical protein